MTTRTLPAAQVSREPHAAKTHRLLWRTGAEQRTSNFLPWHSTYAELLFTTSPWPDVDRRDLWDAITEYARRRRRYGAATS